MNAMRYIVAIYAETHGLTKLLVLHCIMFGGNKFAKASARKWNSWFRIDHSLHATAGSIDEWVVIEYTGYHSNKGTSSTKKLYLSENQKKLQDVCTLPHTI